MTTPRWDKSNAGHYSPYSDVRNEPPADIDIPSLDSQKVAQVVEAVQGVKSSKLTAQTARSVIRCIECSKPRVIYSMKILPQRQSTQLKRLIASIKNEFECGALITPEGNSLQGQVFTQMSLTCSRPIEKQYYGSKNLARVDKSICCYCCNRAPPVSAEDKKQFITVLPICALCLSKGRRKLTWGKKQNK